MATRAERARLEPGGAAANAFQPTPGVTATFPLPRRNRVGPDSALDATLAAAGGGTSIPRARVFPWVIHETATRRNSFSTPRLRGPVIVQSLAWGLGVAGDPPAETIEIGYATTNVQETNAILTTPRPYTVLTELQDPQNIVAADRGDGFPNTTANSPTRGTRIPLGLIISEPDVFVVVAVVNPGGFIQDIYGYLWCIENVSPDALAQYVGAP